MRQLICNILSGKYEIISFSDNHCFFDINQVKLENSCPSLLCVAVGCNPEPNDWSTSPTDIFIIIISANANINSNEWLDTSHKTSNYKTACVRFRLEHI